MRHLGIEPARLSAGDFESVIYSVSTGKYDEFQCRLKQAKTIFKSVG